MTKEFNLSEQRKSYYKQLIVDCRNVMSSWTCPIKFKIQLEEQINLFREVMQDLDKEFIRRLKEEFKDVDLMIVNPDNIIDKLAGKELSGGNDGITKKEI